MKIGVCASVDKLDMLEELGFDRIELNIGAISEMDQDELAALKRKLEGRMIRVTSANCMLHGGLPQVYQDTGLEKIGAYLAMVMPKLKYLGIMPSIWIS